ncbi:YihY/virulence factor BrkB family protein [uncultured Alistipes sp.]|uniref:YihY/virulence factor BrkB family protein n=1 Tax=uncultured Alistipes sp. TaxID=538949 RepID=UPI00266EAC30|nr:YihY/virulence factor BrkB family protein [uncultured Alistipes sp.]
MKRIRRIATFIAETAIGEDSERYRNPAVRWAVQQYRLLFYTARGLVEHGTLVRSAALTFYTLMSIVPVAAVIFAVVKGFGLTETLLDNLYGIFPQHPEVIEYLIGFAERALARTQGGVVAVVALVTLFWAVIRAFASIESAFNNIWEVKTARSLTRQYSAYITIVVVVPLLWAATRALGLYVDAQLGLGSSAWSFVVSKCAVLVMTWLIFAVLYTAIPNTKVRFRSALTAGVVAGTLFMLFQWGYVYLQRWMTSYNAIYGSFAALPLFLIWMQTSWQILLFGGELSFAYQNVARFAVERESLRISYDRRRRAMLAVMVVAARRFCAAQGSTGPEEIRGQLGLPTRLVNDLLYELAKAGMLAPVASEDAEHEVRFVPARDLTSLTLCDVIDAVETQGDATFAPSRAPEIGRVNEAWSRIAAAAHAAPGNVRLIDLI